MPQQNLGKAEITKFSKLNELFLAQHKTIWASAPGQWLL